MYQQSSVENTGKMKTPKKCMFQILEKLNILYLFNFDVLTKPKRFNFKFW